MQLLDVAFFRPLKGHWRKTLAKWREESGIKSNLPKDVFPSILRSTLTQVETTSAANLISGFRATSIYPLNKHEVLRKLPEYQVANEEFAMNLNESMLTL
mgnify:CR=1 FL=1